MSCWQVLELAADSDARAIKRRYAELLKTARPDENPVAFQRLREAYEHACAAALARAEGLVVAVAAPEDVAPADDALAPIDFAPCAALEPETWLLEIAEPFNPQVLHRSLAEARARHAQLRFEHRLLDICLADRADAFLFIDWALAHLEWLTPWQSPQLPEIRMEGLGERLHLQHVRRLNAAVDAADEALAEQWVRDFYQQPWMQVLDRALAYTQFLVAWMVANENVSTSLFRRICTVFGWDESVERLPISEHQYSVLQNRGDPYAFSKKISVYLAQSQPLSAEASAAWMLFKPLDNAQRRCLADGLSDEAWELCEYVQREYEDDRISMKGALTLAPGEKWWRYLRMQHWPLASLWLTLFWLGAFALLNRLPHSLHVTQLRGTSSFAVFFIECVVAGGFAAMLSSGANGTWRWLARRLTAVDVALANRLLPASVSRQGAGLLPLRDGVACVALASLCATLFAFTGVFEPWQVALIAVAAAVPPVSYALFVLFRPRPRWLAALLGGLRWVAALVERIGVIKLAVAGLVLVAAFIKWAGPR